jgi:hypothetical protein
VPTLDKRNGKALADIAKFTSKDKTDVAKVDGITITTEPAHSPLWVCTGRNGYIMYSSDAINWSEYRSPPSTSSDYWDISFGKDSNNNQLWFIPTNGGTELRYSSDPTAGDNSWSITNLPGSHPTRAIDYGANGTWIAATGNDVHRSTDGGTTWTKITSGTSGAGLMLCIATDGAGTWVIGGSTNAIKSYDDGLNWYNTFTGKRANGIEYNNGVWFFASHTTTSYRATSIAQSNTTDTWSAVTGISKKLWAICHITGNTWMTGGFDNAAPLISTDNCASWSSVTSPSIGQVMGLASDGTTIVVCGKDSKIHTSTDNGSSWTLRFTTNSGDALVVEYNKVKPF